jgi:LDH2 family malate/lactate/ureidoglycolate dehydrogenase
LGEKGTILSDFLRISYTDLLLIVRRELEKAGLPASVAAVEADVLVEADLFGVPSHGVRMLPGLISGIRGGYVNLNPSMIVVRERGAACVVDCQNGAGRYTAVSAMEMAVERARSFGIGACLALHTTHWGRAHAYAYRAAQVGMVGICTTNAVPNTLAWGSSQPLLGNNPLAIGVPRGEGKDPIVLDIAMSQASVGKLGTFAREHKKAPAGWGFDANGSPSNDPAVILASRKLLPFGDHKGAGLALMMELLTGALAGGLLSHEVAQRDPFSLNPDTTKLFIVLDVSAFVEPGVFAARVADQLDYLKHSQPGLEVNYPSERGWKQRDEYLVEGIPIHPEIVIQLSASGITLAV